MSNLSNSTAEWKKGDVILDLYEVKDVLGEGGMDDSPSILPFDV